MFGSDAIHVQRDHNGLLLDKANICSSLVERPVLVMFGYSRAAHKNIPHIMVFVSLDETKSSSKQREINFKIQVHVK